MDLNIQTWKEFEIERLFSIKRGDRIVKDEDYFDIAPSDDYKYRVITASATNNGVDGIYNDFNCNGNCLISCGEANGMFTTWQNEPCWVLDTARIYTPKGFTINEITGMFLATLLSANMYRFSYGRKAKPDNMYSLGLKLPIQHNSDGTPVIDADKTYSDEGYVPDWQFMEDYIKSLHHKPLTTKNKFGQAPTLNVQTWGEFRVGDLFDIHPTKFIDGVSSDDCVGYGHPLVVNSAENNGVAGLCDIEPTENGNIITFSDTTDGNTFFYQPKPFIGFAHAQGMYPKNSNITDKVMLFISTMLMFDSKGRYSYGRKMRRDTISEVMLKLPTDANGNPDWQFMENYIKALPYGDKIV